MRIANFVGRSAPRSYRRMTIERLSQHPLRRLTLPVANRDIVIDTKTENLCRSVRLRYASAALTDDRNESDFIVDLSGYLQDCCSIKRPIDTVAVFAKPYLILRLILRYILQYPKTQLLGY